MTRRSKLWLAWLFTLINLGGAPFAAMGGEWLHAAVHVVLLGVGVYWVRRLALRPDRQQLPVAQQADARFEHLRQSVDAIAIEVQRIGEAQRLISKLVAERVETPPLKPHP